MEKKYFGSKFYGSTLNTVLLFILIILMVIALRFMFQNKAIYLPGLNNNESISIADKNKETYKELDRKEILGNKANLISFSIVPNDIVFGIFPYSGIIKGGYFFEGNVLINILDSNKKLLKQSNAVAKGDWMTAGPVNFSGVIDFRNLPKGGAFFEIKKDNPGYPSEGINKNILIPIIIK